MYLAFIGKFDQALKLSQKQIEKYRWTHTSHELLVWYLQSINQPTEERQSPPLSSGVKQRMEGGAKSEFINWLEGLGFYKPIAVDLERLMMK